MTEAVLGIDVGTSSVKVIAVNRNGEVIQTVSEPLKIIQHQSGFNEQCPNDWFEATQNCIKQLLKTHEMRHIDVKGLSLSGQMHSLVILDHAHQPIRDAILWNDTRSTIQCEQIKKELGEYVLSNPVLEGFTLTKLLWIKDNEPHNWEKIEVFLLPKDYVRFKLTGKINMEYSDASSTLLLNPKEKAWSKEIGGRFGLRDIYPDLVASHDFVGYVDTSIANDLGFNNDVAVFAGGGDNACGALGAGVTQVDETLCSIGTSGVILACENSQDAVYKQNIHYFNHAMDQMSYVMGVTLAAGDSLHWLRNKVLSDLSFEQIIDLASQSPLGSRGLLFTPYLSGERTPHGDASIRGSFIGLSMLHNNCDIARSVIEGITFSLYESIKYLRESGKDIRHIVSIGGGAKSDFWLQLQADTFDAKISRLKYEEGPCMGAAILAVYGLGWYNNFEKIIQKFICYEKSFVPRQQYHQLYMKYFEVYEGVYRQTQPLTQRLLKLSEGSK